MVDETTKREHCMHLTRHPEPISKHSIPPHRSFERHEKKKDDHTMPVLSPVSEVDSIISRSIDIVDERSIIRLASGENSPRASSSLQFVLFRYSMATSVETTVVISLKEEIKVSF